MKFRVKKESEEYNELNKLFGRIKEVREETSKLADELGFKKYANHPYYLAGGIGAVHFDEKPEGWKMVGNPWQNLYYPKKIKANKELLERIESLPTVPRDSFKSILNFKSIFGCPGFELHDDEIIITAQEEWILTGVSFDRPWEPPTGLEEITTSEYLKIKSKAENK